MKTEFLNVKEKKKHLNALISIKNILKQIMRIFVLIIIWFRDIYLLYYRNKKILSVLYYHRVTDICQDGMTVSKYDFEKQIRFLKKNYHVLSADELNHFIDHGSLKFSNKKCCLITFDDGYENNFKNALPILKKHSCPVIFFISTGFIGNEKQFEHDRQMHPLIKFKKMDWEQLKEASHFGVEIGIHSDLHKNLGEISLKESINEIETSIKKYFKHFSDRSIFMSYPFGKKNDITKEVVNYIKENKAISALFSAYGGKNISPLDRYDIKRVNIGYGDNGLIFRYKVEGGLNTLLRPYEKNSNWTNNIGKNMESCSAILYITDVFEAMGGAEQNILQILKRINKNKFRPILCCLKAGKAVENIKKLDSQVIDLKVNRIYSPNIFKKLYYLLKLIRKEKIRVIITYHEASDFLGFALSIISRIPIISSKRDMGYKLKKRHIFIYRIIGSFFSAVIAVSNGVKKQVSRRDWISDNKIYPIYNGVNIEKFSILGNIQSKKKELGINNGICVIGMVAVLRKIKGIRYFLHAASMVLKVEKKIKFIIAGHDPGETGTTTADLNKYIQELGISKNVILLGDRTDIPELLSIMDIFVISSLSEGFSNAILEAMAAGKPVVATNVGGNPEAIIDGKTGLLVPPGDSLALANAMIRICSDKALSKEMGRAGKKRVINKFSLERMIKRNEELYKYVIEKKGHVF